ncbi:MAG: enoyl-CoA hydratase/isomerase family protein [Parvibaculaceae bacterium]|nr:enoyl-CoA hydratase/isomerase family protein [Parvibaculaceae bacterium]
MKVPYVLAERDGPIGRIVLNRPDILNPLCPDTFAQCRAALHSFREAGAIRVVVLTGAGRAFCAGADLTFLSEMLEREPFGEGSRYEAMNDILREGHALVRELKAFPGPVVSLLNGPAVGGGAGLALSADIVLAANSAYFALPFVPKLGLIPDLGGFASMQKRMGTARAMAFALLGDRLDAAIAAELGLIWRSVPDERFAEAGADLLARLSALPRGAVAAIKEMSAQAQENPLSETLDLERELQSRLFASPDAFEGISAFLEKRRPLFAGG